MGTLTENLPGISALDSVPATNTEDQTAPPTNHAASTEPAVFRAAVIVDRGETKGLELR